MTPHRRIPPLVRILRHPLLKDSRFLGALSLALPGGSLLAYSHFVEPRRLEVTQHRIPIPGLTKPLQMLHLSDLHFIKDDRWVWRMIRELEQIPCDVAVITGDLTLPGYDLPSVTRMLRALPHPPLGLFMCPGNWEYWTSLHGEMLKALAQETRIQLLIHEAVTLRGGLTLAGVDSELGGTPDISKLFAAMDPRQPAVVLNHCPSLFPKLDRDPVTLVLSGHTHGGQIRLPGLGATWLPTGSGGFDQGWFHGQHAQLYLNRGFGTSLARLRLFCRPEATLLNLTPDE